MLVHIPAVNTQKQYTNQSKEYVLTKQLCLLAGVSGPSTATPVSGEELLIALKRINPNALSANARDKFYKLKAVIQEPDSLLSYGVFNATTDPSINVEAYIRQPRIK